MTSTRTSRTPSTSSPSRATPSITCPTGSCACTAAGRVGTSGRHSPRACRSATATSTCCATRWPSTRSMRAGCISAPRAGRCTCRPTPGTIGRPSSGISPPCCRLRSRRCGDPRRPPAASARAGARTGRGGARPLRSGHSGLGARRARGPLSGAPRDDPRPRHRAAAAVPAVLCLRAGSDPRAAGRCVARSGRVGDGAVRGPGSVRRDEGVDRRVLAVGGEVQGRGDRVAQTRALRRRRRSRDSPGVRGGGLRSRTHAGGQRARGAPAQGGKRQGKEGEIAPMRFMIIVKATKDSEAELMPIGRVWEPVFAEMAKYHEELQRAGVLLDASGLQPSSKGWRIKYTGGKRTVIDGPFTEAKELVAGYTLIQVKSREEALEWARRFPNPALQDGEIEVRQLYELDDFGPSESVERFRKLDLT